VFLKHPSKLARAVLKLFWLTLPARKSAYITCISETTKRELLEHLDFPSEKILVIPTVVNEKLFHFSNKLFNQKSPSILFIGTTPNKNLELAAKALNGVNCTLEIVGKLSEAQISILAENNITYHNEVAICNKRMAEKYQECDFLLFPSTYEGFGMPILEAQLTGRAVITSNYSSMPEVAGDSACLVNPFEIESIRKGILRIIQDENYRIELIEKGKKNVTRYSTKQVAKQYAELYKKVFTTH
jgi:glycosyltransferase involved in cell wall biosynthesis